MLTFANFAVVVRVQLADGVLGQLPGVVASLVSALNQWFKVES